jgi:hypothetical protein
MAQHHNDRLNAAVAKIVDTAFDNGFVSEWKERLKRAHALRLPCGEKNRGTGLTRFHMIIL